MAGSKKMLVRWLVYFLTVGIIFAAGTSSVHQQYGVKDAGHQKTLTDAETLESITASEVEYIDGPLAPLYDFLIQRRLFKFCKLLRDAGLEQTILDLGGSWTLFAPTDASFIFLPGGTLEELQRNPQLLKAFILYHFVTGDFPSNQIQNEMLVDSVEGSPLRFNIYGQIITVSGAQILESDLLFELGRVYIVDRPLYPTPSQDIISYLQRNYREMYKLLVQLNLVDYISSGTFTLLVPEDDAFNYLSQDLKDAIATNTSLAERIILNHILPGSIYVGGVFDGMQWETVGGGVNIFTIKRGLTFANGIPIILPDIPLTNGVIHVLNRVLLPEGIEADCHCKPSSDTNQKPGSQIPSSPQTSFGQNQRPQLGHGQTTQRPRQTFQRQTPQPFGSQSTGTTISGQTRPVSSQGRPWSPSRTAPTVKPLPSPNQITRSPYVQPGVDAVSDDDINRVFGIDEQPTAGQKTPNQARNTRYPTPQIQGRPTPRPPSQRTTLQPTRYPPVGTVEKTRRTQTTRINEWNQRQSTQSTFDQPSQGAGIDPATLSPQDVFQTQRPTVRTPSWQQRNQITRTTKQPSQKTTFRPSRVTAPQRTQATRAPLVTPSPDQISENDQSFESNRQQPNCRQQSERINPTNRNLPVCIESDPNDCQIAPYNPSDPRPLCPNYVQTPNCRRQGERIDPTNRNLPLCIESDPNDCQTAPYNPSDTRPLCPDNGQSPKCRRQGERINPTNRNLPLCIESDPNDCQTTPYNPSDTRPLCPDNVQSPNCRRQGERINPTNRNLPLCIEFDPNDCQTSPYNPSDPRPLCSDSVQSPNCRRQGERINPANRNLPLCIESDPNDCQTPPYNPSDARPLCPDNVQSDCRDPNSPVDSRPLCQPLATGQNCREFGQSTYVGDRRPLCAPSTDSQSGCQDPSAPFNPSDRRPICRTTKAPVPTTRRPIAPPRQALPPPPPPRQPIPPPPRQPIPPPSRQIPPATEEAGLTQGCRRPDETENPQDLRPLCSEEPQENCRPLLERPIPGDRRPVCKVNRQQTQNSKPHKNSEKDQKKPVKPHQQPTYPQRGQYPTQTIQSQSTTRSPQSLQTTRAPQSWQTSKAPQSWQTTKAPQSWETTRAPQSWQTARTSQSWQTTRAPQSWQTTRAPQSWQTTTIRQPIGKQPQRGSFQTKPQTGPHQSPPESISSQSGSYPLGPQTEINPSQPDSETQTAQPQSGTYTSQPQLGVNPSQPQSGRYPSQPQSNQYPSQPQSGRYPSQPHTGSQPQPGNQQSQPHTESHPSSTQSGSYPSQPQSGTYPHQPIQGSPESQPQSGTHSQQPHSGTYPSQPRGGVQPSQPQPGSRPNQPHSGQGQSQSGRPSPGYPQRRPGSQTQGVSPPGSADVTPRQPLSPQGRPGSGQGHQTGTFTPAPRRPTTTTRVPISVTGTSSTPGEDSRRTLYEIVEDPALLIRGRPIKLTKIFDLFHKAGLQEILLSPGPNTVFLPSDDAFSALPKGVVDQLEENPDLLRQVLSYHITNSEILPSAQSDSYTVPSLEGTQLVITMLNGGRLILISGAKAVAVTRANNGIFYVINQLLYPLPHHDIVGAIQSRPDLSTLAFLLPMTGLVDLLQGQTPYTFLAPTDNAFAQLPQGVYDELTRNTTALREILLNHVIEGAHYGREFFTGGTFPSARGGKLKFQVVSYGYQVNEVNIKTPEIVTGTGVIHLVDQVLLEDSDLRFFNALTNSVTGQDDSFANTQQPAVGGHQQGLGPFASVGVEPTSDQRIPATHQSGAGQPQVGGLQPSVGQPTPVGRIPGQGISVPHTTSGRPQTTNQISVPQPQPNVGQSGQQIPGRPSLDTFGGRRQPSIPGSGHQPTTHGTGQQSPGHQSGHSFSGGQRVTTHGQRTSVQTFVSNRQTSTHLTGHTASGGQPSHGTSQTGGQPNDVADLARSMGLNQFANWISNTGLLEKIHDGGVYTVFAPTDDAVSSLPQDMVQSIDSNPEQVKSIMQYHIVPQTVNLNSISNEETASTLLQGKTIRFNVYQNSPNCNCKQLVTASGTPVGESLATMGSIQVIPITQVLYQPTGNLLKIVEASPILQKLNDAVKSARLTWVLSGSGPLTFFAPSDTAFDSLTEEERKTLVEDKQAFSNLLKRHMIRGTFFSSGIQEDIEKKSENNTPIKLSLQEGILTVNSVPVTYADITATNGVLHVIDHFL